MSITKWWALLLNFTSRYLNLWTISYFLIVAWPIQLLSTLLWILKQLLTISIASKWKTCNKKSGNSLKREKKVKTKSMKLSKPHQRCKDLSSAKKTQKSNANCLLTVFSCWDVKPQSITSSTWYCLLVVATSYKKLYQKIKPNKKKFWRP